MQTIKYLASKYLFSKVVWHQPETQNIEEAFASGMLATQRWIPVEEELPVYNLTVLFKEMNNNTRIHLGHRSQLVDKFVEMSISYDNITHWRPIEYPLL